MSETDRLIKREMSYIIKENRKLQEDLKSKNETINSLIDQNFTELKSLQKKHTEIINTLVTGYDTNIRELDTQHKLFKTSIHKKLRDMIDTHYQFDHKKLTLLTDQNTSLLAKLKTTEQSLTTRDNMITELTNQNIALNTKLTRNTADLENTIHKQNLLEGQITDLNHLYQTQVDKNTDNNNKVIELTTKTEHLISELSLTKDELTRNIAKVTTLTDNLNQLTATNQELHGKCTTMTTDNINKQNLIDEKTLELLNLTSKATELEKRNMLMEHNRKELNIKVTDLINQINDLHVNEQILRKDLNQIRIDNEARREEIVRYVTDITTYQTTIHELKTINLNAIREVQETAAQARQVYMQEQEQLLKDATTTAATRLLQIQQECTTSINVKNQQITDLTNYIKSFTESQYIMQGETEKLKLMNEKLKLEQLNVEQSIAELTTSHRKELDDLKIVHDKDKDVLLKTYNDTIRKTEEVNNDLQTRLNQTLETLNVLKTGKNVENDVKYREVINENGVLKEKLERSIELNNIYSSKEKQLESQIKQLQLKYGQLISLTKK